MQTSAWLAVDLGTTHTVAVVGRGDQRPRPLLFDGSPLLSSGVFLDPDGVIHTGRDAERLARGEPDRFEPHPKRRIDDGTVLLGDRELSVEELLAAILRRVASEAAGSGMSPRNVTLTHPADWGPVRRAILVRAATDAGFDDVQLLAEPVAAATYCTRELDHDIPQGGNVAVFDFGGGTFDVAVVQRDTSDPATWHTLAVGGLDDLGGLDVDSALVGHLGHVMSDRDADLWHRIDRPTAAVDRRDRQSFWAEVRAGKEMLSRASTAPVTLPGNDITNLHLTRDELTRLADPLIARTVDETRRTLERAGVAPADLSVLLLVGGSSRMPQVATRLHARFAVTPSVPEQPELPVAYGALLYAMSDPRPAVASPPPTGEIEPVPTEPKPVNPPPYPPHPATHLPGTTATDPEPNPPTDPGTSESGVPIPTGAPQRGRRLTVPVIASLALLLVVSLVVVTLTRTDGGTLINDLWPDDTAETADSDAAQTGTELRRLFDHRLAGEGAAAIAATTETVIIGEVTGGQTELTTLTPEGDRLWSESYDLEPTELRLATVGELLIVDAVASATDEGEDMRAVVALSDGELMWKRPWSDRLDVVFYGTDLVVEQRDGIYDNAVIRIDLTTGEETWHQSGPEGLFLGDQTRVRASTHWADDAADDGAGRLPADSQTLYDNLTAGNQIIELDPDTGDGHVRDAVGGASQSSGPLPLDGEHWTVFEDFAVGKLADTASPGRDVLAAYSLPKLDKAWELPLDAGYSLGRVKPCGPQLVCAAINASGDTGYRTIAVDVETGEQAWSMPVEWSTEDSWYATAGGIVFGNQDFTTVDAVHLLDFDGALIDQPDEFDRVGAVRDGRAVLHTTSSADGELTHHVYVSDVATGEKTAGQDIGAEAPQSAIIIGDLVVVLTGDRTVAGFSSSDPV